MKQKAKERKKERTKERKNEKKSANRTHTYQLSVIINHLRRIAKYGNHEDRFNTNAPTK